MKRRLSLSFIFFCILSGALFAQTDLQDVELLLRRAEQYRSQKDFENAFELYSTILAANPKNIKALNGRGVVYQKRGDYEKARADFQYALALNPVLAESQHNMENINNIIKSMNGITDETNNYKNAERLLGTGNYAIASPGGTQASAENYQSIPRGASLTVENYQPAPPGGVTSLYDKTTMEESIKTSLYNRTVKTPQDLSALPGQVIPQNNLSYEQNKYAYPLAPGYAPIAAEQQKQRLPSSSASPGRGTWPEIPVASAMQGRNDTVKSLRINPQQNIMNQQNGYYERAVLAYTELISRNPGSAVAYNNRGVAYAQLGEWQLALDDFNEALRINPYYFDAQSNRSDLKSLIALR